MASVNVEKSEKNKKMVVWLNPKQLLINNKRCVFLNDSDLIGKKFNKFVVLDVFSKNGYYLFYIPYYLKEENIYTYLENILIKKSLFS